MIQLQCMHNIIVLYFLVAEVWQNAIWSLVPSPQSLRREGSGDIGTIYWLYKVSNSVTQPQCYAISHTQYAHCYVTVCKIVELHSDWLVQKQDSWHCTALLHNRIQNHRAAIWLAYMKTRMLSLQEPRKYWNVTTPFPSQRVGSGDETGKLHVSTFNMLRCKANINLDVNLAAQCQKLCNTLSVGLAHSPSKLKFWWRAFENLSSTTKCSPGNGTDLSKCVQCTRPN